MPPGVGTPRFQLKKTKKDQPAEKEHEYAYLKDI
jgi:hypothetical protein